MPQQSTNPDHNIPGEALIYERAAGIVYARYANPELKHIKRWIIGGNPEGFIPGTGMPRPEEWQGLECEPDWTLIQNNPKLKDLYTKFLLEQNKYTTWEKLNGSRDI